MLRLYEAGTFFILPSHAGSRSLKAGSRHDQDFIFHINTSNRVEKSFALLSLEMCSNFKNTFLLQAANHSCLEKDSPNFLNIFKRIFTWIHSSKPAKLLKITLPVRLSRILPTNVKIYTEHYQQFNLRRCFSHLIMKVRIHQYFRFHIWNSSKGLKKRKSKLIIEFWREILSTIAVSRRKLWSHLSNSGLVMWRFVHC